MKDDPVTKPHPFSADRPIETRSDDLLGRAPFAEALAEAIAGWRERDSLVVALYGGWGSGKTSIKNMAIESLRGASPSVHAIEFNPWEWSSQDRLFDAFFHEIGTAVGRIPGSKSRRLRYWAEKWREYGAYLRAGATVATGLRRLLAFLMALLSVGWLLLLPGLFVAQSLAPIYGFIALMFVALTAFLSWGGRFADQVAEALLISSDRRTETIAGFKANLQNLLRETKRSIVVIIDDIDRLPADQVLSVFQLVKTNADFPGIVYGTIVRQAPYRGRAKASSNSHPRFHRKNRSSRV